MYSWGNSDLELVGSMLGRPTATQRP